MKRLASATTLLFVFSFGIAQGGTIPALHSEEQSTALVETGSDLLFDFSRNALGDPSPTGMSVTSAAVTFDPKKKDKFVLKGTTGGLVLTGATSVIFEAGAFSQEIALTAFTQSKQKYTFKGVAGQAGLSSLILDMGKGQFSATVQNVFLPGFTNPLPITLRAGTSSECRMAQFSVKNSKWSFKGSANPQYDCLMTESPRATARGLLVNQAREITFSVPVVSSPGLNPNSIELFRVDGSFNILGTSLCNLLDNGNPSNGDQAAGDSTYSCIANVQESAVGKMIFIVRGEVGGRTTYSPTFSLDVVTPYTEEQAQQTLTAHQQAVEAWTEKLAAYGNNKKAWTETVKAVKLLEGIKDAGVTKDGTMMWIEFTSGIRGGVPLTQETQSSNAKGRVLRSVSQSVSKEPRRALQAAGGCTTVGNKKVLVWAVETAGEEDYFLSHIFWNSDKNFDVDEYVAHEATVASLRKITDYGTAIIQTLRRPGRDSPVYETGEPVTVQTLGDDQYMLDLLTGCLEIVYSNVSGIGYGYFYGFTSSFISTLDGKFKDNLVYADFEYSAELAPIFMKKEAHTFFGFTGEDRTWDPNPGTQLFTFMVNDGKDAGQAYADVSPRSQGNSYFLKFSSSQDEIAYECTTTRPASCSIALGGNSHWTYEIPTGTQYEYDVETLYWAGGSAPDFTGQFENNVFTMTWDYNNYGTHFWGSIELSLDAPPAEAARVVSFSANRHFKESQGEMASLNETIEGMNIPLTTRTDYGIYFEINGGEVCNHVTLAEGYTDGQRSDGLHRYWYQGIVCTSTGRLYIGFDFLD